MSCSGSLLSCRSPTQVLLLYAARSDGSRCLHQLCAASGRDLRALRHAVALGYWQLLLRCASSSNRLTRSQLHQWRRSRQSWYPSSGRVCPDNGAQPLFHCAQFLMPAAPGTNQTFVNSYSMNLPACNPRSDWLAYWWHTCMNRLTIQWLSVNELSFFDLVCSFLTLSNYLEADQLPPEKFWNCADIKVR